MPQAVALLFSIRPDQVTTEKYILGRPSHYHVCHDKRLKQKRNSTVI